MKRHLFSYADEFIIPYIAKARSNRLGKLVAWTTSDEAKSGLWSFSTSSGVFATRLDFFLKEIWAVNFFQRDLDFSLPNLIGSRLDLVYL